MIAQIVRKRLNGMETIVEVIPFDRLYLRKEIAEPKGI